MKLVGFNFTKINIEKNKNITPEVKISTKIDVPNLKLVKSDFLNLNKEEIVGADFGFIVEYEPDFAKVEIAGNLLLALESNMAKEVLKQWEDKKMPEDFRLALFNTILKKSSLKALQLEEEINLPLHAPLPSLRLPEPEKQD